MPPLAKLCFIGGRSVFPVAYTRMLAYVLAAIEFRIRRAMLIPDVTRPFLAGAARRLAVTVYSVE